MPPEDEKYVHRSLTTAVEAALQDTLMKIAGAMIVAVWAIY